MSRADRIVEIRPDAPGWPWSLFVADETGQPVSYAASSSFVVKVRTAATLVPIAGSMTAAASPTVDRGLPDDVPTFRFAPTAGSLDDIPARQAPATILVYVGSGGVLTAPARHDFPAVVVP